MKHLMLLCLVCLLPTLMLGRSYREKYKAVLEQYSKNATDSLRYQAALFLIDNMEGHKSPEGKQMERFKDMIQSINRKNGIRELNVAWNKASKEGAVVLVPDSDVVTDRMLISNIESAFDVWESAPWKDDIDFFTFCQYILPYRCSGEHIGGNWRTAMKEVYGSLVKKESNMAKAFAIIKKAVYSDVVLSNAYCPYELDAITIYRIGKAECGQRAILLADVLRALGIPSSIDFTPVWADYSNKSHAWVSVIGKNGITYTVLEDDSIAREFNPVDASRFISHFAIKAEDKCPYTIKQTKTPVKIYREEYAIVDSNANRRPWFLSTPFIHDVSSSYNLTSNVIIDMDSNQEVMLCTYVSGQDWMPVACAKSKNGKVTFYNVGKNTVCTTYIIENGKRKYITSPFLVGENGIKKYFDADTFNTRSILVNRKYPLCQYTVDVWGNILGGVFLGGNTPDFVDADTIAIVKTMPYGMTEINCKTQSKYRYFRYKAPNKTRSSLSELQFLVNGDEKLHRINGKYICEGIDSTHVEYLYDNNTATSCRGLTIGYTITVDMGKENETYIDLIRFAPSTDLNFVEKGHLYELYYFDTSWCLIERKVASGEELFFDNVPQNSLLLLKDRTGGKEERIFEFKDEKQIWY